MKQIELFAGIGGFGLAGEWAGIESVAQVEIDDFCQKILSKNFPNAQKFRDIKQFDGRPFRGTIDIISGGFPCQPYSTAGKRLGKEDDRHLWPEMLRVIREVSPRWVVGENVRGLVSWNGGMVFDEVQADLEAEGYEVLPFLLPACAVDAPHRRDRIWFVAYASNNGFNGSKDGQGMGKGNDSNPSRPHEAVKLAGCSISDATLAANANQARLSKRISAGFRRVQQKAKSSTWRESSRNHSAGNWREFPTQSPVCGGNDGVPNRVDRIAALGNAIVPQVAYRIFKAIKSFQKITH